MTADRCPRGGRKQVIEGLVGGQEAVPVSNQAVIDAPFYNLFAIEKQGFEESGSSEGLGGRP